MVEMPGFRSEQGLGLSEFHLDQLIVLFNFDFLAIRLPLISDDHQPDRPFRDVHEFISSLQICFGVQGDRLASL